MTATQVSFADAIKHGTFGPFAIGASRHTVGETLGEPTDAVITNRKRTSCIWRYGTIEFHFDDDLLALIHCDANDLFDGGPALVIDPWKLRRKMPLVELKTILDANAFCYTGVGDSSAPDCSLKLASGCSLGFVLDSNAGLGPTGLRSWSIMNAG